MIKYEVHVYPNGTKHWHLNGKLHREDGPAIEYPDGTKEWRLNGKLHREDGPAYEGSNGDKEWFLNGKLHRKDGPAYEGSNGTKEWFLNGNQLTEAGFLAKQNTCEGKVVEIDGKKYRLSAV